MACWFIAVSVYQRLFAGCGPGCGPSRTLGPMFSWHSDLTLLANFQGDCIKLHSEQPFGSHASRSACLPAGHTVLLQPDGDAAASQQVMAFCFPGDQRVKQPALSFLISLLDSVYTPLPLPESPFCLSQIFPLDVQNTLLTLSLRLTLCLSLLIWTLTFSLPVQPPPWS